MELIIEDMEYEYGGRDASPNQYQLRVFAVDEYHILLHLHDPKRNDGDHINNIVESLTADIFDSLRSAITGRVVSPYDLIVVTSTEKDFTSVFTSVDFDIDTSADKPVFSNPTWRSIGSSFDQVSEWVGRRLTLKL